MKRRSIFLAALSAALIGTTPIALRADAAKKGKKAAAAKKDKKDKKDKDPADAAKESKNAAVVKKDIKKEASLDPKSDFKGPVGSEAASKFEPKAVVGERMGPALKIDSFRAKLEKNIGAKREEQLKQLEQILEFTNDEQEKASLYFRRGELIWEKSKEFFFKSQEASTQADEDKFAAESKKLQQDAVADYKRVVKDYPQFERVDEVLYYLGVSLIELGQSEEASEYYRRLISEFPNSQYVPDAWLAVGDFFFDKADLQKALKAYQKAEEFTESTVYGFAVYKQGWCYINSGEWEKAMDRFRKVIKYADTQLKSGNKARLSLRKEAQKDYVRSYSNVGTGREAKADFLKVGGKDNYRAMLESLGNIYVDQGKHKDVIALFSDLIQDTPNSTRNAVFQGRVVEAASRLGNKKYTVSESRKLANIYLKIKKTSAETTDPAKKEEIEKDLKNAADVSENTVRRLATSYHQEAIKTKNEDLYGLAMELYSDYLSLFPDTIYAYDMRFFYAELLYKLEEFEKAAVQYSMVVDMRPDPNATEPEKKPRFLLLAAEEAVRSYDNVVSDLDKKNPPKVVGIEPVPLPELKAALIKACERYLFYVPKGPRVVEIGYKMARIYYIYNQFEKAAPAFLQIAREHPKHETAVYSANLVLDIYNGLKDYETLEKLAREFYDNKELGDPKSKGEWRGIIESATFKKIEQREKSKDYLSAADAYMAFTKEFPDSQYVEKSVYNAAVNYDKGGKLDQAISTRRYLIDKFPKSELVPTVLYNIAESYERVADFEKAATEYELFAQRYNTDKRAEDALFNAGVYRRTLLQHVKAKESFYAYLKAYPNAAESTKVQFSLCEMQEERKDWGGAEACYFDFYRKNKAKDVDRWLTAQYKRGLIFRDKTKYMKGAHEALDDFEKQATKKMKEMGKEFAQKMPYVNEGLAALALIQAEGEFAEYKRLNFKDPGNEKAFKKSLDEKLERLKKVKKTFESVIITYKEPDTTLAALYYMAESLRDVIRAFNETPIPKEVTVEGKKIKLTDELKEMYKEKLKAETLPFEEQAIEAYKACNKKANDLGVYNRWSVKALERLHDYRPDEFPLITEMKLKPQTTLVLSRAPLYTELPKAAAPVEAEAPVQPAKKISTEPAKADDKAKPASDKKPDDKKPDEKKPEEKKPDAKKSDTVAKASEKPGDKKADEQVKKDENAKEEEPKD
ncbi:MAG: tetratricopeptide repeat protein [Deltaproteobacteria bacterium]|nr:tetratricopeptide repeat protein [Deltaproteobacteria bacterium]